MKELFAEIERCLPDGGQWCDLPKATTMAAMVVAMRPQLILEIGVWYGGSLIPQLLALKHVGSGKAIAIDPWERNASVADQTGANQDWWSKTDHEAAYQAFLRRVKKHEVEAYVDVRRARADDVAIPTEPLTICHVDGNHGPQAVRDVERFAPCVHVGGVLVIDDVGWEGLHVSHAVDIARSIGFVEMYPLGTGIAMQRRSAP